jgi:hypothetical protein
VQNHLQKSVQMLVQSSVQMIVQKHGSIAETVQNLPLIGGAEKNGSDADEFAEEMQKTRLKLYVFSAKLDKDKHGYDGFAQLVHAEQGARLIRSDSPNPPNSRSILSVRKNCADAEACAVIRADRRAVLYADVRAVICAEIDAETAQNFVQGKIHPQQGNMDREDKRLCRIPITTNQPLNS